MDLSQVSCWCLGWWPEGKDGASVVVPEERALMGAGVGRGSIDLVALRPRMVTPGLILRGLWAVADLWPSAGFLCSLFLF